MNATLAHRLRPVPNTAPRVLGLIRVSKERDGMVSPDIQRVMIGDYSRGRGYEVVDWLEGIDQSGSRARSAWWPTLERAVAAVEAGAYDGIVVRAFDRTARNRLKWATAIDRLDMAGGFLESATEQIDVSTAAGRFTRGMFGEMAAFKAEMIGEGWKETHASRIRAGKPPTGKPKWGYVYDVEAQLHVPDEVTGPVLADMYRRYTAGESIYQLVRWLNGRGFRTTAGGLWSDRSLRRVLDSGFASGRFLAGGDPRRKVPPTLHQGVHEPLITEVEWQAYLDAREGRRARPARSERSQYLLSGLVRCARCKRGMVAGQYGAQRAPKYRCKTSKEMGPEACPGGYVMARFVEAEVVAWLEELAEEVESARAAVLAAGARRTTVRSEGERLARELGRAEEALVRFAVQNAQNPLPETVAEQTRAELTASRDRLEEALEAAQRSDRTAVVDPAAVARGLLEGWHFTPVEHRREVLRSLIGRVLVTTGRPRAIVDIRPAWETP